MARFSFITRAETANRLKRVRSNMLCVWTDSYPSELLFVRLFVSLRGIQILVFRHVRQQLTSTDDKQKLSQGRIRDIAETKKLQTETPQRTYTPINTYWWKLGAQNRQHLSLEIDRRDKVWASGGVHGGSKRGRCGKVAGQEGFMRAI